MREMEGKIPSWPTILLVIIFLLASFTPMLIGAGETETYGIFEEQVIVETLVGSGTEDDPYLIEDVHDLQNINRDLDAHYKLANDINASETLEWNNGSGFEPLGKETPFTGSFNGNDKMISELFVSRRGTNYVGIFSRIGEKGVIRNLVLVNNSVSGEWYVGTVAGENNGLVEKSDISSNVYGKTFIGGITGRNNGTISNVNVTTKVRGTAAVGGAVGSASSESSVKNMYGTSNIKGSGELGGLIGLNYGIIENSHSNGKIFEEPPKGIAQGCGGLVSSNFGIIRNSSASSNVNGYYHVGGLVKANYGTLEYSYSKGDVIGVENVGGLVGVAYKGRISNTYSIGNVLARHKNAGGLVGRNNATIYNSYALGDVDVLDLKEEGEVNAGGFVGKNDGLVESCYAVGNVTSTHDSGVSGLIGINDGTVIHSFWDVEASGIDISDGGTGLRTKEMSGKNAPNSMDGFDFSETWETIESNDKDALDDGYPIFREWNREEQLKAQGVYTKDDDIDDIDLIGLVIPLIVIGITIGVIVYHKKKS